MLTKTKAQTQYQLKDGTTVPSVTTILNILSKPILLDRAWKCGWEDLDYREVQGSADDIATLARYLIACHLKGKTPNTSPYSPLEVEKAKHCLTKYQRWEREHPMMPVIIEMPLVSEDFKYGGTPDLLAELDGGLSLVDFEIGKAVYRGSFYQLAAYWKLVTEQGWPLTTARVLGIGTDEDEAFEEWLRTSLDAEWGISMHCLTIYRLQD